MILHWLVVAIMVLSTALVLSSVSVPGQESSYGQRLSLNVYLDNTGKSLVTGYAENVSGLTFLNASQYRFENDTRQLYALTDGLTVKKGDLWTMSFVSLGNFDDYHVAFYLPGYMKLGKINVSDGLTYLLSASNESLVVDTQGYEVHNPKITIDYQQPLAVNPPSGPPGYASGDLSLTILLVIAALLILGSVLAIFIMRRKDDSGKNASEVYNVTAAPTLAQPPSDLSEAASPRPKGDVNSADEVVSPLSEQTDNGVYFGETTESASPDHPSDDKSSDDKPSDDKPSVDKHPGDSEKSRDLGEDSSLRNKIEVSSEMEAVMQTLTARERAVMSTLISHGGRMTQAEIRYGTGTPKSSLTGILISLERRKLITKKEWGRTNIIELSEWFLTKKERS
jgi:flagellar basal body-associated protein FliL